MPRARRQPSRKDQVRDERRANRQELRGFRPQDPPAPSFNPAKLFNPSRITPKGENQKQLIRAIEDNDIVYGLGPAGSGKTYLAVAKAVEALQAGEVRRIVLIRPCIGVGPTLGFLKGDLIDKVSPFLRPLLDELGHFYDGPRLQKLIEDGTIELTSLEYARGRTFKHAYVILDEAQNATEADFEVFLTRLGEGSKYVITGDLTRRPDGSLKQCDLPRNLQGALEKNADRFTHIPGIACVALSIVDIVRHPLVKAMIEEGL